jgi:hypothetical protein
VTLNAESYAALVSLGPRESGRVFREQSLRKAYENAVAKAKLDDVNFHTLRHTFASWAVMREVSLKELQELLGHGSLAMTTRYAHLAPERLRSAVTRLEGLTSSTNPPPNQRTHQRKTPAPPRGPVCRVADVEVIMESQETYAHPIPNSALTFGLSSLAWSRSGSISWCSSHGDSDIPRRVRELPGVPERDPEFADIETVLVLA